MKKLPVLLVALLATAFPQSLEELLDRYTPNYHLARHPLWDPNGGIHHNGTYHMMYIFPEYDMSQPRSNYGHVTSPDMFHWTQQPDALTDGRNFSGNAFKDKSGRWIIFYHMYTVGNSVAVALDDDLLTWEKPENMTPLKDTEGTNLYGWDPYGWLEGDTYYAIFGGDEPTLHKSTDLEHWDDLGSFIDRSEWSSGRDMSTPKFFPVGDKYVYMFIAHNKGAQYVVGTWENESFTPEYRRDMNWPGASVFAMETIYDDKGRKMVFAWVMETRIDLGNQMGVLTMPRVFTLDNRDRININPPVEVETLRSSYHLETDVQLSADSEVPVEEISGDTLEIELEIDPGTAKKVGIKVLRSPGEEEVTVIEYDTEAKTLNLDVSRSSLSDQVHYGWGSPEVLHDHLFWNPGNYSQVTVQEVPFELDSGEPLQLRIFIDRSILEVFVNGRECVTQRLYPTRDDAVGVSLFAQGGSATVNKIEGYNLTLADHGFTVPVAINIESSYQVKPPGISIIWWGKNVDVTAGGNFTLELYDVKGKRFARQQGKGFRSFGFSSMEPGMYFVNINMDGKQYRSKVIFY